MPSLDSWRIANCDLDIANAAQRAAMAWERIQDRPTSITVTRGTGTGRVTLAAQTVRLEWDDTSRRLDQALTTTTVSQVIVFGIRSHATLADTNLKTGDRFNADGTAYEVMTVVKPPGEIQAVCQAVRIGS